MPVIDGVAPLGTTGPVSADDLVEETLRHLFSGHREQRNVLAEAIDASVRTVTLEYDPKAAQAGAMIEVGHELMYVQAADAGARTLTVQRAEEGSAAVPHDAGAKVTVNPKFPRHWVMRALNSDLNDLSSPRHGLFQIKNLSIVVDASRQFYDLPGVANVLDVQEIRREAAGGQWPELRGWEIARSMDRTDFSSGLALRFPGAGHGDTVLVRYRAPFGILHGPTDDAVKVTGLHPQALDLPPLGAALRLLAGRPVKRAFTESQGDTRRAEEVTVQDGLISTRGLSAEREQRIMAESARLSAAWPRRKRRG